MGDGLCWNRAGRAGRRFLMKSPQANSASPRLAQDVLLRPRPLHVQLATQSTRMFLGVTYGILAVFLGWPLFFFAFHEFSTLISLYNDGCFGWFLAYLKGFPKFFAVVLGKKT